MAAQLSAKLQAATLKQSWERNVSRYLNIQDLATPEELKTSSVHVILDKLQEH